MAKPSSNPTPAPAAAPPAAPPTHGPPPGRALAPTLVEMPKNAPDPVRDFNARKDAAIAKASQARLTTELEAAKEGAKEDPKAKTEGSQGQGQPPKTSNEPSKDSPGATSKAPDGKSSTASTADAEPAASTESSETGKSEPSREARYSLKSLKRWAEENPEEAAEVAAQVFSMPQDANAEYVRIQNKRRKVKRELREAQTAQEQEFAKQKAELDARAKHMNDAVGYLQPIADLFRASAETMQKTGKPDFDACDAAFEKSTGLKFDDYARLRARSGIRSPEAAQLRATNLRLERELAEAKAKQEQPAAKAAEPAEAGADKATGAPPKATEKAPATVADAPDWSDELPKGHKFRKIADWQNKLGVEMKRYYDEDLQEYSADPEQVADKLLKRELAALADAEEPDEESSEVRKRPRAKPPADEEEAPKPRAKRPPPDAKQFQPDEDEEQGLQSTMNVKGPKNPEERFKWAMKRAMDRARQGAQGDEA